MRRFSLPVFILILRWYYHWHCDSNKIQGIFAWRIPAYQLHVFRFNRRLLHQTLKGCLGSALWCASFSSNLNSTGCNHRGSLRYDLDDSGTCGANSSYYPVRWNSSPSMVPAVFKHPFPWNTGSISIHGPYHNPSYSIDWLLHCVSDNFGLILVFYNSSRQHRCKQQGLVTTYSKC